MGVSIMYGQRRDHMTFTHSANHHRRAAPGCAGFCSAASALQYCQYTPLCLQFGATLGSVRPSRPPSTQTQSMFSRALEFSARSAFMPSQVSRYTSYVSAFDANFCNLFFIPFMRACDLRKSIMTVQHHGVAGIRAVYLDLASQ